MAKKTTTPNAPPGQHPEQNNGPLWDDPSNYIQIGCNFYRKSYKLDARMHVIPILEPWLYSQLKRDFAGKTERLSLIPRYEGVGYYPCNTSAYQQSVRGYYNLYCPLPWVPVIGEWPHIDQMLHHIFGGHFEYGLDYIQLLIQNPTQMLPILVLLSLERNTGKTTFLNFLKEIFGHNMAFVDNESMRSRFNAERAGRLIIGCDETFLNKKEDSERLKNISTARTTYIEYKGKDRFEVDNYAKFILASNNVNDPVYIDAQEVRYWVLDVPSLSNDDPNFLEAMKEEIPAFLGFLQGRQLSVPYAKSRMWFDMNELRTPALMRIIQTCRPTCELELAEMLLDIMDEYVVDKLEYTTSDLTQVIKNRMKDIKDAHRIVCKQWHVPHAGDKLAYDLYAPYAQSPMRCYGRFYTFTRDFLETLVPSGVPTTPPPATEGETGDLFSDSPTKSEEMRNHSIND